MKPIHFLVIPPIGDTREIFTDIARLNYDHLKMAIEPHLDEYMEHVAVLYDGRRCDMFVGETSAINGRHIRNVRATAIYRNNALTRDPTLDPESLPAISGPAVLFPDEIVWR